MDRLLEVPSKAQFDTVMSEIYELTSNASGEHRGNHDDCPGCELVKQLEASEFPLIYKGFFVNLDPISQMLGATVMQEAMSGLATAMFLLGFKLGRLQATTELLAEREGGRRE